MTHPALGANRGMTMVTKTRYSLEATKGAEESRGRLGSPSTLVTSATMSWSAESMVVQLEFNESYLAMYSSLVK